MIRPTSQAVTLAPDGGYPGANTAEGQNVLFSRTTGGYNTAVGYLSLRSDDMGNFNTGVGAGTLLANIADENTVTGAGALLSVAARGIHRAPCSLAAQDLIPYLRYPRNPWFVCVFRVTNGQILRSTLVNGQK